MPKPARTRTKACAHCQATPSALFRVVHDTANQWVLICATCRAKAESHPFYRYGGTWKADKRH